MSLILVPWAGIGKNGPSPSGVSCINAGEVSAFCTRKLMTADGKGTELAREIRQGVI
jgi:hypothetical protein